MFSKHDSANVYLMYRIVELYMLFPYILCMRYLLPTFKMAYIWDPREGTCIWARGRARVGRGGAIDPPDSSKSFCTLNCIMPKVCFFAPTEIEKNKTHSTSTLTTTFYHWKIKSNKTLIDTIDSISLWFLFWPVYLYTLRTK